jgi:hypothetical protein
MDGCNLLRRDPANLNHRLSLQEVRALSPAFSWDQYFKSVNAPQTDHYLVMTPEFFKGMPAGGAVCKASIVTLTKPIEPQLSQGSYRHH